MLEKKLELVEWRDANFEFDADDSYDMDSDYIVASVGWIEERPQWLVIVAEITPGGERAVTRVPRENVVRRVKLKVQDDNPSGT